MGRGGGTVRWRKIEALVRRLEPRIIRLFEDNSVDPNEAARLLEETVTLLLFRWTEVAKPEIWMMEMLEHRVRRLAQGEPPS